MRALRPSERTGVVIVASCVVALAAALGITYLGTSPPPSRVQPSAPQESTPFIWPGKNQPPTVAAADAGLADDEIVIGVLAKKKARAYRRAAFDGLTHHVVNDVLGDTPVTVAHCDRNKCSRVYTGPGTKPLDIKTGGYLDGMLLYVDGVFYDHDTGRAVRDGSAIPFTALGFEETTWAKWRAAHPETDVYLGSPTEGPTGPMVKE